MLESDLHSVYSTLREPGPVLDLLHLLVKGRRVRGGESLDKLVEHVVIGGIIDVLVARSEPHGLETVDEWCSCDHILTVPPVDS